jgi:hypothetical protein
MPADVLDRDTPLGHEPAHEALPRAEVSSGLAHAEQCVHAYTYAGRPGVS